MAQEQLDLDTTYQVTALKLSNGTAAHRISVEVAHGGAVRVMIDPNSCELDAFGTPTACTLMAQITYEGRLLLLDEREGEWLFSVEAPDAPALFIVLRSLGSVQDARLLVVNDRAVIKAVVALGKLPKG